MTVYELRIWPIPHHSVSHPLRVEMFQADTNGAAEDHMHDYAARLRKDQQVFLWAQGGGRSIASADGLADLP